MPLQHFLFVLTVKVPKGCYISFSALQQLICMIGRCMGQRKKIVIIKLTHQHFEPIVFDRVLRFDDAILLTARFKILPKNTNLEGAHTATLEGSISKKMYHQVTGHAGQQLMWIQPSIMGVNVTGILTKCLSCSKA